ncbi:hypothetical protein AK812_SmicGene14707 [Symbiodinium microadriaticum]|uniref:Endonuclease/exonuclease/phosphatase domain-containing protein n=1 Tax=Symbiodinium microadriaticum TaxID=2951 RepID=A0A1Q9E4T1_SYMMI|nr:hypothetical protein AK812_SmicGene14707 [Symbiodinium microadriaticum]
MGTRTQTRTSNRTRCSSRNRATADSQGRDFAWAGAKFTETWLPEAHAVSWIAQRVETKRNVQDKVRFIDQEQDIKNVSQEPVRLWPAGFLVPKKLSRIPLAGASEDKGVRVEEVSKLEASFSSREASSLRPQMRQPQAMQGTQSPQNVSAGRLSGMCLNINSLVRHRDALLDLAAEQHADILMVQKTGCTTTQWPAMCKYFHHRRWQLVGVPAATVPGGGRGGVAIIVRDPLSVTTLDSYAGKQGQRASVAVHGADSVDLTSTWQETAVSFQKLDAEATLTAAGILRCNGVRALRDAWLQVFLRPIDNAHALLQKDVLAMSLVLSGVRGGRNLEPRLNGPGVFKDEQVCVEDDQKEDDAVDWTCIAIYSLYE